MGNGMRQPFRQSSFTLSASITLDMDAIRQEFPTITIRRSYVEGRKTPDWVAVGPPKDVDLFMRKYGKGHP